jgi:hypothetical protein
MSPSAQAFVDKLTGKGIQCDHKDTVDGGDLISVWFSGSEPNVKYEILVVIDKAESSVIIRCYGIYPVAKNKRTPMLKALNQLNMNYRWVKFYLDEDSEVAAGADAIINPHTAADVTYEMVVRTLNIIDDGYAQIKKAAE